MKRLTFLKRCDGMTLAEVMLVMIIIAISAAIAYPSMQSARENKQKSLATDSMQMVSDAVRKYVAEYDVSSNFWQGLSWDALMTALENQGYVSRSDIQPGFEYTVEVTPGSGYGFVAKMIRNGAASSDLNDKVWFQPAAAGRAQDRKFSGKAVFQRDSNPNQF